MRYASRPNVDQLSRDAIEDSGLPLAINAKVDGIEEHLAQVPIVAKSHTAHLGRAS